MTNNNICLNACWEKVIKSHTLGNKLLIAEIGREWLPAQLARGVMRVMAILREVACLHGSGESLTNHWSVVPQMDAKLTNCNEDGHDDKNNNPQAS